MKKGFIYITVPLILIWSLPYFLGWINGGEQWDFSGFLLNPIDGLSYIAKMKIGQMGGWRFTLPYSAEGGNGAYLFLFYIALGHLARLVNLPLLLIYHLVRVSAGLFMAWTLWTFIGYFIQDHENHRLKYVLLLVFGSGLGWMFSPLLGVTSDFWVAEAYPFLSGYTNPHFPLGISLILWILMQTFQEITWRCRLILASEGLLLSVIMPFGLIVLAVVLLGNAILVWLKEKRVDLERSLFALIPGGGFLAYQYFSILSDPQLSNWNSQNITSSPAIADLLVSFSPALILVMIGLWKYRIRYKSPRIRLMIVWVISGAILISIPFPLQRRFITGFFIPVGFLAMYVLCGIQGKRFRRWSFVFFLTASVLTNVLVLLSGWYGITTKSEAIYLTKQESLAVSWLSEHVPVNSLILASPQIGSFIPALTPHRVIYGHPFETINADFEKVFVESMFDGSISGKSAVDQIRTRDVDYIFYGPREAELGQPGFLSELHLVYENPEVKVFSVQP